MRGLLVCLVGVLGASSFGVGWQDGAGAAAVREEDPFSMLGRLVKGPAPKETVAGATAVDLDAKFGPEMGLAEQVTEGEEPEVRARMLRGFRSYNERLVETLREAKIEDDLATAFALYVMVSVGSARRELVPASVTDGVIRFVRLRLSVAEVAAIPKAERLALYAQLKWMTFRVISYGEFGMEGATLEEVVTDEMQNLFGVGVAQIQFRETGIEFGR